jgi:hypothetical protein
VRDNPKEKNLGGCSPCVTIPGVGFSVQLALWEAYNRVIGNGRSARLKFNHELNIPVWWHARKLIGKDIGILANYWNFIKVRSNGHIGTGVCTVLER